VVGDKRVGGVPTAVIILSDVDRMSRRVGKQKCHDFCNSEAAATVQNMRLTAADEGIASCWITGFDQQVLADKFGVPTGGKRHLAL